MTLPMAPGAVNEDEPNHQHGALSGLMLGQEDSTPPLFQGLPLRSRHCYGA